MTEIRLNYTDEYGDRKRIAVSDEIFTVGRHPQNDLCIPDHRLSREHLRFELYADKFYVSDSGSSNGTTLNGSPLSGSTAVNDGDRLNLGGAVEMKIETDSVVGNFSYQSPAAENQSSPIDEKASAPSIAAPAVSAASSSSAPSSGASGIPKIFFIMLPIFGLAILLVIGAMVFLLGGKNKKEIADGGDEIPVYTPQERTPKNEGTEDKTPTPKKTDSPTGTNGVNLSPVSNDSAPTPPPVSGDAAKIEQNAGTFLRRIAQNDPHPFLTTKQVEAVSSKISQFEGSSALAENLKAVKKNAAQFESMASSKNLKPQFLAAAALAKIGSNRGDPAAVAATILPYLNDLKITLDNKLADDNLLIIAAYERGAAGKARSLQSTLEALSKTTANVSPREIRTIWFLKNAGKITDAEYNFALQFLAVGTIMQNPKDFNVNTDAVTFE